MAIKFYTENPAKLLDAFKKAIAQDDQKGRIETWRSHKENDRYFTHTAARWELKAWVKPVVEKDGLAFYVVSANKVPVEWAVYSYYQSKLAETFCNHFFKQYQSAVLSAQPVAGDKLQPG